MRQSHALRNARRPIEPPRQTPVQPSVRVARVHPALLWTPFALALVGLLFQGSVAIGELNRLTRDGYAPDPLMTLRPVLMQALWLLMGAGVLWGCSRVRGRFLVGERVGVAAAVDGARCCGSRSKCLARSRSTVQRAGLASPSPR
jgi:hypothetical protein